LRRAMESGAVGFLLKDAPASELAVALRRVMKNERVVDPDLENRSRNTIGQSHSGDCPE